MPLLDERLLCLVDSIPAHGAIDVSPGRHTVTLVFDDNVVDNSVWFHNRNQIRMWAGTFKIPIRVTRINTAGQRRKIFVTPINGLPANTKFTIAVSPDLVSASGLSLGRTAIIKFTTARVRTTIRRIISRPIITPEE